MRGYIAFVVFVAACATTAYAGNRHGGFASGHGGFPATRGAFSGAHESSFRGAHGGGHGASLRGAHGGGHGSGYGYSQENYGPPTPYQFGYSSQDQEGTHGHSQSSDGRRVQGHYVIQLADGRQRRVEYHADETGFHAKVITNELGTESKDAADAIYQSSAITGEQAALQFGAGPKSSYAGGQHGVRGLGHSNAYNKW